MGRYTRVKTWIAGEVLRATDLPAEYTGATGIDQAFNAVTDNANPAVSQMGANGSLSRLSRRSAISVLPFRSLALLNPELGTTSSVDIAGRIVLPDTGETGRAWSLRSVVLDALPAIVPALDTTNEILFIDLILYENGVRQGSVLSAEAQVFPDADAIHRIDFDSNPQLKVRDLPPYSAGVTSVTIAIRIRMDRAAGGAVGTKFVTARGALALAARMVVL